MELCYIFSLCGVVLYNDPRTFLRTLWKDAARAARLYDLVFLSPEWQMLAEGSITREDAMEWLCRRSPAETEHIRLVLKHWLRCLTPRWETVELLLDMKDKRLFFSADIDAAGKEHITGTYPFLNLFEGGVFSCDRLSAPPYEELCRVYGLEPQRTVWIDDNRERLLKAEAAGLRGIHFTGAERLRDTVI